jgi:hypothetical protein
MNFNFLLSQTGEFSCSMMSAFVFFSLMMVLAAAAKVLRQYIVPLMESGDNSGV